MVDKLLRSEILFLYDVKDANPNGDPLDENKPRMDEETRTNIVTDVRLKRTIRDYLKNFKEKELFVTERTDEDGYLYDAKTTIKKEYHDSDPKKVIEKIKQRCIDIRLFGATIPTEGKDTSDEGEEKKGGSIKLTGPVQFRMGRSLNKVEPKRIQGTGAFASTYTKKKKEQQTFREEWIVPYSLIAFNGVINENAAKDTGLTVEDVNLLIEGIWKGTNNLITRSKFGQKSRLLLVVQYKEENFFIGDLDKLLKLTNGENIRDVGDYQIDVTALVAKLEENKDKIEKTYLLKDDRLQLVSNGQPYELSEDSFEEIKFV